MRQKFLALSIAFAIALAGCDKKNEPLPPENPTPLAKPFTIKYDIYTTGAHNTGTLSEGGTFSDGKHDLEFKAGHLTINTKDFGRMKAGDAVVIDQNDSVTINGEHRNPQ